MKVGEGVEITAKGEYQNKTATCTVEVEPGPGYFVQEGTTAYYFPNSESTVEDRITITTNQSDAGYLGNFLGMKVDYTPDGTISVNGSAVGTSDIYRLFYIDIGGNYGTAGTIYLKANAGGLGGGLDKLPATATGDDIVLTFNPKWSANATYSGSPKTNMTYVNRLLDKNIWDAYKDDRTNSAGIANYVIGAPSLEMWIDAYNVFLATYPVAGKDAFNCTVTQDTTTPISATNGIKKGPIGENKGYGYYVGHGGKYTENNGFYVNSDTLVEPSSYSLSWGTGYEIPADRIKAYNQGSSYWLASPSASNSDIVMYVRSFENRVANVKYGSYNLFCPLVCCNSDKNINVKKWLVSEKNILIL